MTTIDIKDIKWGNTVTLTLTNGETCRGQITDIYRDFIKIAVTRNKKHRFDKSQIKSVILESE